MEEDKEKTWTKENELKLITRLAECHPSISSNGFLPSAVLVIS